jgi:hypothetical protein
MPHHRQQRCSVLLCGFSFSLNRARPKCDKQASQPGKGQPPQLVKLAFPISPPKSSQAQASFSLPQNRRTRHKKLNRQNHTHHTTTAVETKRMNVRVQPTDF